MRITTTQISSSIVQNLNIDLARLNELNLQVTTGKKILKPSDDPLGAQRVVNINEAKAGIEQYQRNADYVMNWISVSETALDSSIDQLQRANEVAIRASNDAALTQNELNDMAVEVNNILNSVFALANTKHEGKSIFGGFQTMTEAYTATLAGGEITSVTYAGDSGAEQIAINETQVVNKNVPGNGIFTPAAGVDVFAALIHLRDDLRAGNLANVNTAITLTENGRQQIADQVGLLGNKTNLIELNDESLSSKRLGLIDLESQLADVDMPDAIVQLQTAQNVYNAALQSSAMVLNQRSLMDFLG